MTWEPTATVESVLGLTVRDHLVEGLFVREVGPGAAGCAGSILLIPGGFHGYWSFEPWVPVLAAGGWRCFSMSLRGHSGSRSVAPEQLTQLTIHDYLADVRAVIDFIGESPVLLGHSMGGLLAQMAAPAATGMVLVSSVGPGQLGGIRPLLPVDRPLWYSREEARALWFHDVDEAVLDSVYGRLTPESPSVLNSYSGGRITIDRDRTDMPILVIGGEEDATPVHRPPQIAGFYGADWVVVARAGHDLMYERAGVGVVQLIVRWLARRIASPTSLEAQLRRAPGLVRNPPDTSGPSPPPHA